MSAETPSMSDTGSSDHEPESSERREALLKLGKYTAYAAPAVLFTVSAEQVQAASGPPVPSPPPGPVPSPPPGPAPSPPPAPSPSPGPPTSDIRLKRDIALLSRLDNGIGLYRYRYLWSDTVYVGVMAQEVARVVPDAVSADSDGYLRVDYAQLQIRLLTWDKWLEGAGKDPIPIAA
jgi:hypothetical protein